MSTKVSILIDGGFLRVKARFANIPFTAGFIDRFARNCTLADETIFRILYYDCAPSNATVRLPVSNLPHTFNEPDDMLHALASKDLFAVRRGVLKFRGYKPRTTPITPGVLTDADFKPDFEQKGVDMRIGLDIAAYSANQAVERIIIVTNDTDCVPAMKYGRKSGLQVVTVQLPNCTPAKELIAHSDYKRLVTWP